MTPPSTLIREARHARGWSIAAAARALIESAPQPLPDVESVVRSWKRWEHGTVPSRLYRPLLARLLYLEDGALGDEARSVLPRDDDSACARGDGDVAASLGPLVQTLLYRELSDGRTDWELDVAELRSAVASLKRAYQACQYADASHQLGGLLGTFDAVEMSCAEDELRAVDGLNAAAHHVAASMLLKFGEGALACVAADRSMTAARRSGDPLALGTSTRVLSRALLATGHAAEAMASAEAGAARLANTGLGSAPDRLSVYGSLLLRAATVAARRGDRARAAEMLTEADRAATRLGGDHNHCWTAFGPLNVTMHRVDAALALGDAGTAIEYARTVDPARITVAERRVTLHLDTAAAYAQWRRPDQAHEMLRAAERTAPEEMRARPRVRALVRELMPQTRGASQRHLRALGDRVGVFA